jgi:hypothetical protein
MTWVVGTATMFGHALIFADVCVTFRTSQQVIHHDLVQKIHPVGQFMAAGFSGSVRLGFMLLQDLLDFLRLPEDSQNQAWLPDWVVENWAGNARAAFQKAPAKERSVGVDILVVGVHPTEDVGIPGWAKSYVSVLRSPDFVPILREGGNATLHIGSGSEVPTYARLVEEYISDLKQPHIHAVVGGAESYASHLLHTITLRVNDNPIQGVSRHLHSLVVQRGKIGILKSDYEVFEGGRRWEVRMPQVARTYPELLKMAKGLGLAARGALCD